LGVTDKLFIRFRAAPLLLLVYGIFSAFFEFMSIHATVETSGIIADTAYGGRMVALSSYVGALYSFFFYFGFAALAGVAMRAGERGRS
jgi:hypothetical protein